MPDDDDKDETSESTASNESPAIEYIWTREARSETELIKRLHASTSALNLRDAWPEEMVVIMEELATQAGCPVKYVAALMPAVICTAAGPNVRVSAWHEGCDGTPAGWLELLNITCFLASRSGGGKSNCMRILKHALKQFERICNKSVVTTGFTIEALLERIKENGTACCVIDEGRRLRDMMNQYKGGKGDDALVWMEIQNGESQIIDRKGSSLQGSAKKKKKEDEGSSSMLALEADEGDGEEEEVVSNLRTQELTPHACVLAGTHDKTVIDWHKPEADATDGKDARLTLSHVPSASNFLSSRSVLKMSARNLKKCGQLHSVLVLIRIFTVDVLYAQAHVKDELGDVTGLPFGLLELDEPAYVIFASFYNRIGEEMDALAEEASADGGHQMSALSKARGNCLKNAGIIALSEIATSAYKKLTALHELSDRETTYDAIHRIAYPHFMQIFHDLVKSPVPTVQLVQDALQSAAAEVGGVVSRRSIVHLIPEMVQLFPATS